MATLDPQLALPLTPAQPESVQPGGFGIFVRLELAWGRLRRGWLRRFRPAYVRRMAERRQGHCDACSHDIIDSRDLKYVRNVCGYGFGEDDDPFRGASRVRLARAGLAEVAGFSALFFLMSVLLGVTAVLVHWAF